MSSTYKSLFADDIVTNVSPVHEEINITGTLVSSSLYSDNNILNSSTNYFQTVYDYPYLSASSNQLFDITFGFTTSFPNYSFATDSTKKKAIYSQLAHMLVGHDTTGSIYKFDIDGDKATGTDKYESMFFMNFSRLLYKDSLRKGVNSFKFLVGSGSQKSNYYVTLTDSNNTSYNTDSPVGDYGLLTLLDAGTNIDIAQESATNPLGFIFYDAGVVAISPAIFTIYDTPPQSSGVNLNNIGIISSSVYTSYAFSGSNKTLHDCLHSSSIPQIANEFRKRINNITIQNTTELRSSTYFCRVGSRDFNYSSNPTYVSSSQIRVVEPNTNTQPHSYVTSVGLYSPQNELLAVAKLSEPLKKTFGDEFVLKIRLDF